MVPNEGKGDAVLGNGKVGRLNTMRLMNVLHRNQFI